MQLVQNGSLLDADDTGFISGSLDERNKSDIVESSGIAAALALITEGCVDDESIDLHYSTIPRISDTTFDNATEFARVALSNVVGSNDFAALAKKHSLSADTLVCIDEQGAIRVLPADAWIDLSGDAVITKDLQVELLMLGECAAQTGGWVFCEAVIGVRQWLNFHQYAVPATAGEARNLIALLEFKVSPSPITGDYHELLSAPVNSAFHLSAADRQTITQITKDTTKDRITLLEHIATADFSGLPPTMTRERAAANLEHLLQTPEAGALGILLHERLGWHLDADNHQVAGRQIRCMVATALILDIGFGVEKFAKVIAGYHLYQVENASLTSAQVVEAFEWQLTRELRLSPAYAQLAAHLLLAYAAPQLLVRQAPADLTIGKTGWVVISQAVALIELSAPGASRMMTYAQIKEFSDLAPASPSQRALHDLAAVTPIIDWAVLNGVLPYSSDNEIDVASFTKASARFSQYVDALNEVETGISAVPPDRRQLALQELQRVLPAGDYLQQRAYKFNYVASLGERNWLEILTSAALPALIDGAASQLEFDEIVQSKILKLRVSILDLYLSGDLVVNGRFNTKFVAVEKIDVPKGAFSRLTRLQSVDALFDQAFDNYYQTLQRSQESIIKMAVANLPEPDGNLLANGLVTLYTVRKTVNPLNPFEETQGQRNEGKGRYGILLSCEYDGGFRCYELFPLRGLCRQRPDLAEMLRTTGVVYEEPSLYYQGKETDFQPKNPAQQWPLDAAAYADGSQPKDAATSMVVVEKLWHFLLQADDVRPVALYFSRALEALAEGVMGNHPVATRQELYSSLNTQTELQKIRAHNEAVDTTLINVIVPFKKCIEDIRSGDAHRVTEGVGGCILDGLAILGLLVGFGATVAGIISKTASSTAKALSIAKAGVHFSVSLLNPVDGLPSLALQGTRLAKRGVLLLSKHGLNAVETATGQLRKLTGSAQSYDLIKAAQKSDLFQGTWKAAGDLGEPVNLLALQRNSEWYALNLRVGGAWGPKLKNLKVSPLAPLRRLFGRAKPFSYTKGYVSKALPAAKSKLDNAALMLSDTDNADMRAVLKHIFGNDSDDVLKHVRANLHEMRKDLDVLTLANMSFRKGSEANAALRPVAYKRWKASVLDGTHLKNPAERFMVIYPEGLDDYYRMAKYDDGRIGDVLVHEMAHGAPDTLDLYYGQIKQAGAGPADMDVAGLLDFAKDAHKAHPKNLSNPHFNATHGEGFELLGLMDGTLSTLVKKHPALLNADSYSLAVSMLDQARTHRESFLLNLARIQNGLKKTTRHGFIDGSVRLKLAKASV